MPLQHAYSVPLVVIFHTLGQIMDTCLFIYLVNGFFRPRKGIRVPRSQTIIIILVFSSLLAFVDLLSKNNFYTYYAAMLVLPLFYSIFFSKKEFSSKLRSVLFSQHLFCPPKP